MPIRGLSLQAACFGASWAGLDDSAMRARFLRNLQTLLKVPHCLPLETVLDMDRRVDRHLHAALVESVAMLPVEEQGRSFRVMHWGEEGGGR